MAITSPASFAALIRHGDYQHQPQVPGAMQPYPLNADGALQARQCVPLLTAFSAQEQLPIAAEIHTSCLLRAWQTADVIAQGLAADGHRLIETERLTERRVGSLANLTLAEIEQVVHHDPRYADLPDGWKSNSHFCLPYPGAESLMQAGQRVADYIVETMQTQQQRYAAHGGGGFIQLFVGHGAAFRHAAYHLGVMRQPDIKKFSMHYARPIFLRLDADHLDTGSRWHHHRGEWKLRPEISQYTD